jgi:hypothetical protein
MSRTIEKAVWLANRLKAMSPLEIAYRTRQASFRIWAKRNSFELPEASASETLPNIPGLKNAVLAMADNETFTQIAAKEMQSATQQPFHGFGKTWPVDSEDGRWHRDPITGTHWPQHEFCFSINFRHRNHLGDVKYVWQYNKLQHLHWPAVHAALKNDAVAASFCVREIESWLRANPPFNGVNWASGVECSTFYHLHLWQAWCPRNSGRERQGKS